MNKCEQLGLREFIAWTGVVLVCLLSVSPVAAEVRTITAIGEYRMGDNDTRADAKRLALQDAKRLALEKAGTLLESVTEVKNFQLTRDEIRAYTAGIIEVVEHRTRADLQGETTVIFVDVTATINMDILSRQIGNLRRNETASVELVSYRQEAERLRQALEAKTQELTAVKSKAEAEILTGQRQQVMNQIDVQQLLAQAWIALAGERYQMAAGTSTPEGRARAKNLTKEVLSLNPNDAKAYRLDGIILYEEGDRSGAVRLLREAIHLKPDYAEARANLGVMLAQMGYIDDGIAELRAAIRIDPTYAKARANLAAYLLRKRSVQEAISEARQAIQLKSDFPDAYATLGRGLSQSGNHTDAIEQCRAALRLDPLNIGAHWCLGYALDNAGSRSDAVREYREFLRLAPNTSDYSEGRAWVQDRLAQLEGHPGAGCASAAHAAGAENPVNGNSGLDVGLLLLLGSPLLFLKRRNI